MVVAARASALMIVSVAAGTTPAAAETVQVFTASATIVSGCSITAGSAGGNWGAIDFGTTNALATQSLSASLVTTTGTGIEMDCTPGLTASVTADAGSHAAGGARQLANTSIASAVIPYLLYADGSATAWTTQSIPLSFPVGTSHRSLPVRAVASLGGPMPGGLYTDMVRITVSW